MAEKKVGVFCNRYNEFVFLCNEIGGMKFGPKRQSTFYILNLN